MLLQVTGSLDDCTCDVETIDAFNNEHLFPKLQKLLESDYFRFYKVGPNNLFVLVNLVNHTMVFSVLFSGLVSIR